MPDPWANKLREKMRRISRNMTATPLACAVLLLAGCCCCGLNSPTYSPNWSPTPRPHIQNLTDADFDSAVLRNGKPTLVDFWAPWCGPCQMVDPAFVEVAEEFNGQLNFARVNVDENSELAGRYRVWSIPTLVMFHNGELVAQHEGVPMSADQSVEESTRAWVVQQLEELE